MSMLALGLVIAALPDALNAELDRAWKGRTPATQRAVALAAIKKLKPHAKTYEGAWRLARAYCWLSERKPYFQDTSYKERMGKLAMKHAKNAIKLQPNRVEGHYFYAWAIGQWSLGISIPKALWNGAEGKLRKAMKAVERIDRSFDYFGVTRMWGRFFHALPWPKHDRAKSLKYLHEGLKLAPRNMRGYFFLAEAQIKAGQTAKACQTVAKGLTTKPSVADEPDYNLWQRDLKQLKATGCKKLLEDL